MHSRELLDSYLSRALSVPLENNRLKIIDDSAYVLTLDYTLKMLNIHERHECGMPVIIEGETGVGKTALVEVLSKLWNYSHLFQWTKVRETLLESMTKKMDGKLQCTLISNIHRQASINIYISPPSSSSSFLLLSSSSLLTFLHPPILLHFLFRHHYPIFSSPRTALAVSRAEAVMH